MNRRGFSAIELLTVLVIVGIITAFGIPRIRTAVLRSNVRSAKVSLGTLVVKARAAAVSRGCTATMTLTTGQYGTVSISVCNVNGTGTQILGGVDSLAARYNIYMTPSTSTLAFDPRGLAVNYATLVVGLRSMSSSSVSDSVIVNPLGQVVRQ
ncbi:MAG TPA: GspH/FimT family pseudopilin [Gemmatimonadales bacterium]|jgi:prepilin-type N-terminal cleavage/methylation domain-containing protein|nr:GspH/FimT family pseudopilin [Gemmatimonadales bacterium]